MRGSPGADAWVASSLGFPNGPSPPGENVSTKSHDWDLVDKKGFCSVISSYMILGQDSPGLGLALGPRTHVLRGTQRRGGDTQEGHVVTTEMETGVMRPQPPPPPRLQGLPRPPETGRGSRAEASLRASGVNGPCRPLGVTLLASGTESEDVGCGPRARALRTAVAEPLFAHTVQYARCRWKAMGTCAIRRRLARLGGWGPRKGWCCVISRKTRTCTPGTGRRASPDPRGLARSLRPGLAPAGRACPRGEGVCFTRPMDANADSVSDRPPTPRILPAQRGAGPHGHQADHLGQTAREESPRRSLAWGRVQIADGFGGGGTPACPLQACEGPAAPTLTGSKHH
ncbi:hypothetical protein HJG60_011762 [Phyllostomus discolor]|uniref:Uncharacterized protein n=1 Tax=Phyllostomus discolor TaxID=89673 RepID=A0A833ZLG4_9CHIR|nr:hypothetical protein HJG60_011762 [Phyllostomus discolor]